jgi:hypothetical protein
MNIPKEEFHLRTDVSWFLPTLGTDPRNQYTKLQVSLKTT